MDPAALNNTYLALRHGQSLANVRGLIVSHPDNGLENFGLSREGREQVRQAVTARAGSGGLNRKTAIFSSDFLRTRHTAQIAARVLGCTVPVTFTPQLRERCFGTWELTGSDNYQRVWADDARGETAPHTRVESADQVLARALALVKTVEAACTGKTVLLVSHGDTLQILMTWFAGYPPHRHRELPHLETAEVRNLSS